MIYLFPPFLLVPPFTPSVRRLTHQPIWRYRLRRSVLSFFVGGGGCVFFSKIFLLLVQKAVLGVEDGRTDGRDLAWLFKEEFFFFLPVFGVVGAPKIKISINRSIQTQFNMREGVLICDGTVTYLI